MSYEEKRVTVNYFGTLPESSPHLRPIASADGKGCKLHVLAAEAFAQLAAAAEAAVGVKVLAASGWRKHRWTSRAQYEAFVTEKYGSVAEGRKYLAYDSPHETGLAVDFGSGGLEPVSKTIDKQKATPLWKWLVDNADKYGWHPYKREPWHWEFPLSRDAFKNGCHGEDDEPYAPPTHFGIGDEDEDALEELDVFGEVVVPEAPGYGMSEKQ